MLAMHVLNPLGYLSLCLVVHLLTPYFVLL